MTERKVWIGIDPGVHTGFAEWDATNQRFINISTLDFWRTVRILEQLDPDSYAVVIEDASKMPAYSKRRSGIIRKDLSTQRDVGQNIREGTLIIELCRDLGILCVPVEPTKSKIGNADYFRQLTGYERRTSQHGRDAAMLVWRREPWKRR